MMQSNVVVIGAGVIGLTTALLLAEDESKYSITLVAKHMPGDIDIEYASPWAGANWSHGASKRAGSMQNFERATFPFLANLAHNHPEAGVHFQDTVSYSRTDTDEERNPWYKELIPDFKHHNDPRAPATAKYAPDGRFPNEAKSANSFNSLCINSPVYCSWLMSKCLAKSVVVRRADLAHLLDARNLHHSGKKADVLVNCTGFGARSLPGTIAATSRDGLDPTKPAGDPAVYPIRGQLVVVRNSPNLMVDTPVRLETPTEVTYIMERAAGGGTILGGSYQPNCWDATVDSNLANRIMARAIKACPGLVDARAVAQVKGKDGNEEEVGKVAGLSVIRHGVGLRPSREGGVRVERGDVEGVKVVHQYGHGGAGYQSSVGSARLAVELVNKAVAESGSKARL